MGSLKNEAHRRDKPTISKIEPTLAVMKQTLAGSFPVKMQKAMYRKIKERLVGQLVV